ncbi:amino acid ABC transporter permease [Adlercreutzia muris]|jgi:polar amino acid transport system permease protein|uniref:amino acid ABC transporter permease n=1 Tax=Adlercreutzia muris TaxID=1796610 RepID=UPI0013665EBB|nr:amino acid ABC transporter permease [Adlercreutzia muris]MCI8305665.1 amino acid ABC transporter permease [Enterorhabdus sp.]MCI9673366.1 amino acid ABC transporter permease [Enterorhabdus sp.]NCA31597.1 amino acid ABC transporter permease [Adlercreutzia muris]
MNRVPAIFRSFTARAGAPVRPAKAALNYLAVCVVVVAVVWTSLAAAGIALNFDFITQYRVRLWDGFCMTVGISAASLVISLIIGIAVAAGQGADVLPVRYLCDLYVKIIRGTPLIVQVYFFYYIIGTAWGVDNRVLAGIIILSLFSGAYIAEILRGSLLSLDAGQLEAARAVGFTRAQTLRYVVAPQLVARTLPALTGQVASIIKDSSLLSVIAVIELTQTIREITATNYNFFGGFLLLGALYLALTLPIMAVSRHFEKRLDYEH